MEGGDEDWCWPMGKRGSSSPEDPREILGGFMLFQMGARAKKALEVWLHPK